MDAYQTPHIQTPKKLIEECLQHRKEVLLEYPPLVSNVNEYWGKHFQVPSPGTAKNLEIHFHGTNISSSQLLPSFPLIPPGTTKSPPSIFPISNTFLWKETNMIRMDAGFRKEERINRNNFVLSLIHTRHFATVQRKLMFFPEYLCDNGTGNAKGMGGRLTKASSQEKWKENWHKHTKLWLYSAYNNRRLLHIWCGRQSITECFFHSYPSCNHESSLPRCNFI